MRYLFLHIILIVVVLTNWVGKVDAQELSFTKASDSLSVVIPALNNTASISVSNISLQEFMRTLANATGLNLNVDPALNFNIINNFSDVRVRDILSFIEINYPVKISAIGNIINITEKPVTKSIEIDFKGVKYEKENDLITLDYYQTNITQVAKEITRITGKNIILSPVVSGKQISTYVENMPFNGALEQLAFSNDLNLRYSDNGYYILEPKPQVNDQSTANRSSASFNQRNTSGKGPQSENYEVNITKGKDGKISVFSTDAPLKEVISKACEQLMVSYFIAIEMNEKVNLNFVSTGVEDFLDRCLNTTPYLYTKEKNIYVIGSKDNPSLKNYRVYQFQNRTMDLIIESIPDEIKNGLTLKEFPDLNSIILSGPESRMYHTIKLLNDLDKTVPVILIEVIIVDVNKNYTITTGIEAGSGSQPVESKGKIFPEVDIQLGSDVINKAIESFDGFGIINLGPVNTNFYLTLKAMEKQGILSVRSTPQLATLNGYEANMSIGNTEYYLEEQSNIIGSQNPSVSTTQTYKSVNAELSLKIRPIVSGDDQITLNIEVMQSDFTERISKTAPPGSVSRTFQSIIRIKNQETIILGGLEEKRIQDTSSGVPLLSRVPVIKWLFSSRNRVDTKSKLNIFIKPTIIG